MTREEYEALMAKYAQQIEHIRKMAHELHQSVNQTYGDELPYGYHLDMVVNGIRDFGHLVLAKEEDLIPLFFGGYFQQALMATEIAYALTNDKGRTRAERAGEKYYKGIRETPYAPFVKLCDRLANITYSCSGVNADNLHMKEVYKGEVPHFLASINPHSDDQRLLVPQEVVLKLAECLIDDLEREEQNESAWWHEY